MRNIDCERIERLARELTQAAGQARSSAAALRTAARLVTWTSPAASAFEQALTGALGQLSCLDTRLDELAKTVSAHGRRAADRADSVARAAASAARAVEGLGLR